MITNLDCAISCLADHRDARQWSDEVVAADLLLQLGLDPNADAANPKPVVDPDEAEVAQAEAAAKKATDRAMAARARLDAKGVPQPAVARDEDTQRAGKPKTTAGEKPAAADAKDEDTDKDAGKAVAKPGKDEADKPKMGQMRVGGGTA